MAGHRPRKPVVHAWKAAWAQYLRVPPDVALFAPFSLHCDKVREDEWLSKLLSENKDIVRA
ncbi:MAG: hypothetical protein ACKPKO_18860, partial [Candidatus Fonsibacter sp.]